VSTNPNTQVLSCWRGEDVTYEFSPLTATDITGWTLAFTVSDYPGADPVTLTIPNASITKTDATAGEFSVPLTRAQTSALTNAEYSFDIWRINSGSYERLAGGQLVINTPELLPA
jgi:hypothetical protein